MKHLQKFILPVLLLVVVFIVYKIYFSAGEGLGSFSDFDPNNNAVKAIRVQLLVNKGISQQGGAVVFYVSDKNGKEMMVNGEVNLSQGFESAQVITLKGHLSQNGFHAHEVLVE